MAYASAATPSNRRTAYRVAPDTEEALDLAILSQRQQLVRAVVEDVAFGGARVRLDRDQATATALAAGEQITLALRSLRYRYKNHMPARVVSVVESDHAQTLHLAFEGAHADMPTHSNEHFTLFNRRALQRGVMPTAGINLEAEVTTSEVTERSLRVYPVGVRNISNVGISLKVSPGFSRGFAGVVGQEVDEGVARAFVGVGRMPVLEILHAMTGEQLDGVVAEPGVERLKFALVGRVRAEFVDMRTLPERVGGGGIISESQKS